MDRNEDNHYTPKQVYMYSKNPEYSSRPILSLWNCYLVEECYASLNCLKSTV